MKRLRKPTVTTPARPMAPRQLAIAFESPQLWRMHAPERRRIVSCLATLLTQAVGGVAEEESGDEGR